jgi:hypothetical protein
MKLTSPEDIDLVSLSRRLPPSAYRLRAFTQRAEIVLQPGAAGVANVRITQSGPRITFDPIAVEQLVANEDELAFIVFHEWMHVLCNHLSWDKMGVMFGVFLKTKEDWERLQPWQRALIQYAQELEIKHMEHILMPDDRYHEVNRKLFAQSSDPKYKIFWRDTDIDEVDDEYCKIIHGRIFSRGLFSTREAFHLLQERTEENQEQQEGDGGDGQPFELAESGSPGGKGKPGDGPPQPGGEKGPEGDQKDDESPGAGSSGDEGGSDEEKEAQPPPLIGSESGIDEDVSEEMLQDILDAFEQVFEAAQKAEAQDDRSDDKKAESEEGDTGEKGPDPSDGRPGGKSAGTGTMMEQGLKERIKVPRKRVVERAVTKAQFKPNYLSRIMSAVSKEIGGARSTSNTPNFLTDRAAQRDWFAGKYRTRYKHKRRPSEGEIALYYDLSYSQDAYIPYCNEVALQMKTLLADQKLYVFGDYVVEVGVNEFARRVRAGSVQQIMRGRGTNFRNVVRHAKEHKFQKLVIITDNRCGLREDDIKPLMRQPGFYLLLVQTDRGGDTEADRNRVLNGGFAPFMDKRIFLHDEKVEVRVRRPSYY